MNIRPVLRDALQAYFEEDFRRIDHARKVTDYAEELLKREGGDYIVVIGASMLHDVGIKEAEKRYGSSSGKHQEKEGPAIARRILTRLGFEQDQIEEICAIIAHHHSPGKINTLNFKVLYDADQMVNLEEQYRVRDRNTMSTLIDRVFLTRSGKALAEDVYLKGQQGDEG